MNIAKLSMSELRSEVGEGFPVMSELHRVFMQRIKKASRTVVSFVGKQDDSSLPVQRCRLLQRKPAATCSAPSSRNGLSCRRCRFGLDARRFPSSCFTLAFAARFASKFASVISSTSPAPKTGVGMRKIRCDGPLFLKVWLRNVAADCIRHPGDHVQVMDTTVR